MSSIEILNTDCMEYMKDLPDKAFELAIVDPPYFSGPERRIFYGSRHSKIGVRRLYKKSASWIKPTEDYFTELTRVAKKYIFWGANCFHFLFHTGRIVWDKVNDSSRYSDCEIAATNAFDHVRIFRYMWNGMLQGESIENGSKMQGNKKRNEQRIHPTQKPVVLYQWLLKNYAKPGDRILDTHGGSCSIAIACDIMGFDAVICELDPDYYKAAVERFERHKQQTVLEFGA